MESGIARAEEAHRKLNWQPVLISLPAEESLRSDKDVFEHSMTIE